MAQLQPPLPLSPPRTRDPSPQKNVTLLQTTPSRDHSLQMLQNWQRLHRNREGAQVFLDGASLQIGDIVSVGKYGSKAHITDDAQIQRSIDSSIGTLHRHLQSGHLVYGVTTGFGGSADTRTTNLESLQRALVQHQNAGVLTPKDIGRPGVDDFDSQFDNQSMPSSWVRASMLTRCNTIIRGHSAVRLEVAEAIMNLLRLDITPVVPLRGTISASGDLSPLSYIAAAIEGSPDIYVRCGKDHGTIMSAQAALQKHQLEPVVLRAKEGLGLLNGTAFSAATAALAVHASNELAVFSQVFTAMGVEAMQGTAESFYPQIAAMRPHPGQIESAANILGFLAHSKLAQCVQAPKDTKMTGLYQDRYAWRTASQWIGPQLEDLAHAQRQVAIELNSTTDNPLIDTETDHILHGGNFQAAVVTSTMDRARLAIEKLGRMLFAQATEIVNPALNNGLPANLASDNPSLSYTCKGLDINIASYAAELGFLANPVGNHVMSAEMHNQAINSMAMVSARYTLQALDILRIMSSAYLFMLCQALDLRVLQHTFMERLGPALQSLVVSRLPREPESSTLSDIVLDTVVSTWPKTTTLDIADRCSVTAQNIISPLVQYLGEQPHVQCDLTRITSLVAELKSLMETCYNNTRADMYANHMVLTPSYLGRGSRAMYNFVRGDLGIKFHQGLVEHPTQPAPSGMSGAEAAQRKTIGSQVSIIYEAIRDGRAGVAMLPVLEQCLS